MKRIGAFFFLAAAGALAQPAPPAVTITSMDFFVTRDPSLADVQFDKLLDTTHPEDATGANVTLTAKPSGTRLTPGQIALSQTAMRVSVTQKPPDKDTSVEICFATLHFIILGPPDQKGQSAKVCKTSDILTGEKVKALITQLSDAAQKKLAEKSSSEKNIFASGFVTTAGQNKTAGGADISLNKLDLGVSGMNSFLNIKKTSVDPADPKHFEVGVSWRSTSLFQPDLDKRVADVNKTLPNLSTEAQRAAAQEKLDTIMKQYGFWQGVDVKYAAKLEGDPTHFQVTNAVGEVGMQILSRTERLFGSTNGYYRARINGPGFEGGRNLGAGDLTSTTASQQINWIARSKIGGEFTLYYHNPQTKAPFKRIELNLEGVHRYLFHKEVMYDSKTKKNTIVDHGSRPYGEATLKLFIAEDQHARYGFRLAWMRGSLPPVFGDVKSFQFGFVVETTDGDHH